MICSDELKKIFDNKERQQEINKDEYVNTILQTYLECGEDGVFELCKLFRDANLDMEKVRISMLKIISTLLKCQL
jgi:hypothetical protein